MPSFKGTAKINELFDRIVNDFKSLSGSGWTIHYEDNDKFVISSLGSSGGDRLFVIFEPGNTRNTLGSFLTISIASEVSTVDGSVPDTGVSNSKDMYFHSDAVDTNLSVDYELSAKDDRIIMYLQGDINSATGISNLGYFGLLNRYSSEVDSNALCIGVSYQGDNGVRTLADINGQQINNIYDAYATILPVNPGWGELYHMSPVIHSNNSEGARGELFDIYFIPSAGVSHGDEIQVGTKTYKVYQLSVGGNSFLPGSTVSVSMD